MVKEIEEEVKEIVERIESVLMTMDGEASAVGVLNAVLAILVNMIDHVPLEEERESVRAQVLNMIAGHVDDVCGSCRVKETN